jgi:hypothetical protein
MPGHQQTLEDYESAGDPCLEAGELLVGGRPGLHGKEKVYGSIP